MRCASLALIACLLMAAPVVAQEGEVPTIPYDGPHLFCHVLHKNGMTPIASFAEAINAPEESVIIILGDPGFLDDQIPHADRALKKFLSAGGGLLIATDQPMFAPGLGFEVSGRLVQTPPGLQKSFGYREEPECPALGYVLPDREFKFRADDGELRFKEKGQDFRDHPLFQFLHQKIATNCPSHIAMVRGDLGLRILLDFPFGQETYMIGSARDAKPGGRALYIAGHGIFMNAMMAQTDNDNFEFAGNAIRWLRAGPKKRVHPNALLIVNGWVIADFDMKLTPPIPPIPMPRVTALNRLVRGWEDERFFQKNLAKMMGDQMGRLIAVLVGIVTLLVLVYGTKKFLDGRHHLETTVPLLVGPSAAVIGPTPSEQRQQAMMGHSDFWEASRQLALEWFRHEFDVSPDRWLPGIKAQFHAEGSNWWRGRLQKQADGVLRLARTAAPIPMSHAQLLALIAALSELGAAAKKGRLALHVEGKNVRLSPASKLFTAENAESAEN